MLCCSMINTVVLSNTLLVNAIGINLFDKADYDLVPLYPKTDGGAGGAATLGTVSHSLVIEVEPETDYTFSMYDNPNTSNRNRMNVGMYGQYPYDGLGALSVDTSSVRDGNFVYNSFTTPVACHYILVFLWSGSSFSESAIDGIINTAQLQLQYGNQRTDYEPFTNLSFTGSITPLRFSSQGFQQGSQTVVEEADSYIMSFYLSAVGGSGAGYHYNAWIESTVNSDVPLSKTQILENQIINNIDVDLRDILSGKSGVYKITVEVIDSAHSSSVSEFLIVKLYDAVSITTYELPALDLDELEQIPDISEVVNLDDDFFAVLWGLLPENIVALLPLSVGLTFLVRWLWK